MAYVKLSVTVSRMATGSVVLRRATVPNNASNAPAPANTAAAAAHTPRLNGSANTFDTAERDGCRNRNAPLEPGLAYLQDSRGLYRTKNKSEKVATIFFNVEL